MTMIERVARHMHAKLHLMVGGYRDFDSLGSGDPDLDRYDCKEWWIEHARAAIEAMRKDVAEEEAIVFNYHVDSALSERES